MNRKTLSTAELEAKAQECFEHQDPSVLRLLQTADGQCFLPVNESQAIQHARTLGDTRLYEAKRSVRPRAEERKPPKPLKAAEPAKAEHSATETPAHDSKSL